jgi:hypothetical protein
MSVITIEPVGESNIYTTFCATEPLPSAKSSADERKESNSTKIIVIPGNPGVIEFYQTFINALYEGLGKRFPVFGSMFLFTLLRLYLTPNTVGHAGHGAVGKNNSRVFTLEDQIAHKAMFLERFAKGTKFIVLGHSVGSYIALKVLFSPFSVSS